MTLDVKDIVNRQSPSEKARDKAVEWTSAPGTAAQ